MLLWSVHVLWGRGKMLHTLISTCMFLRFFITHAHICDCACIVYFRPEHSIFPSSLPANEATEPVFPPGLSCPAAHSCEEQHSAERDICSVRECPNYSWSFNHSGFSLCGICGVSHKCVTATLVNSCFNIASKLSLKKMCVLTLYYFLGIIWLL